MIYTGNQIKSEGKEIPDTITMKEAFFDGKETAVDIRVKVLRTATEQDIIGQYIIFAKVYNEQRTLYGETEEAVTETIRICKDRNVLKAYLESKEREVVDIMKLLFDEDTIYENYVLAEKQEKARQIAANFIRKRKLPLEDIADATGLSLEEVKEIEAEVFQMA